MADFRRGFFCRPDKKKLEPQQEEESKTCHIADPKCKPAHVDARGRRLPTVVVPRPRYASTTETYTEEAYSSSRDDLQHSHTKNYEPVKSYGLQHDKGIWHPSPEFNKVKVQVEENQLKHEMMISEPMNDIEKAIACFKEAVNHLSGKNIAPPAPDHPKKGSYTKTIDSNQAARRFGSVGVPPPDHNNARLASDRPKKDCCTKTIDSNEAARRFGNFGVPPPEPSTYAATINCKEAEMKYKGATV